MTLRRIASGPMSSPSSQRAWIEMLSRANSSSPRRSSPSSQRAWIEITALPRRAEAACVALLAEGVDRNYHASQSVGSPETSPSSRRAWIEISLLETGLPSNQSPSSRRAWIEIHFPVFGCKWIPGSPSSRRAWIEIFQANLLYRMNRSPSSRRAWIEIQFCGLDKNRFCVALLAEGVDRNNCRSIELSNLTSRPPRGGRG